MIRLDLHLYNKYDPLTTHELSHFHGNKVLFSDFHVWFAVDLLHSSQMMMMRSMKMTMSSP